MSKLRSRHVNRRDASLRESLDGLLRLPFRLYLTIRRIRMNRIGPARLLPGATVESIADGLSMPTSGEGASAASQNVVTGRALIFWDATTSGKKRDAIDTD